MSAAINRQSPERAQDADALITRVLAGEQSAFAVLMQLYNRSLYRAVRSILRDDQEAEDAVQEAWILAYRKLSGFRGESSLATWLTRIAVNAALARRRQQTRQAQVIALWDDGTAQQQEDAMARPDEQQSPEKDAMRAEMRRVLEHAIDSLPEQFRTVFILRALEEMPSEDVAAVLDIPESTARTRFFRARAMLRELLAREVDVAEGEAFGFAGERCARITRKVMQALEKEGPGFP